MHHVDCLNFPETLNGQYAATAAETTSLLVFGAIGIAEARSNACGTARRDTDQTGLCFSGPLDAAALLPHNFYHIMTESFAMQLGHGIILSLYVTAPVTLIRQLPHR